LNIGLDQKNGFIYVADTQNNRIVMYSYATLSSVFIFGTNPPLQAPACVTVDCWGNVWVCDSGNNRVLRYPFGFNGTADLVVGQTVISGSGPNSPGTSPSQLSNPSSIEFNEYCTIMWIADNNNDRVLQYNFPILTNGQAAVYALGTPTNSTPTELTLQNPADISYSPSSYYLWIADKSHDRAMGGYLGPCSNIQINQECINGNLVLSGQNYSFNGTTLIITGSLIVQNNSIVTISSSQNVIVFECVTFGGQLVIVVEKLNSTHQNLTLISYPCLTNSSQFSSITVVVNNPQSSGESSCGTTTTPSYGETSLSVLLSPTPCENESVGAGDGNNDNTIIIVVVVVVGCCLIFIVAIMVFLVLFTIYRKKRGLKLVA